MRVIAYPADDGGCGFYRLRAPADVLLSQGMDIEIRRGLRVEQRKGKVVGVEALDADVVVLQRPLRRDVVSAIPYIKDQGIAVVVEVDDDWQKLDRDNPARKPTRFFRNLDHNWVWLRMACTLADVVTVSTEALAKRFGKHGRVVVLPNCVPSRYLDMGRDHRPGRPPVLGWSGNASRRSRDLAVVGDAVQRAVKETGAKFKAIGSSEAIWALGLDGGDWTPWQPLDDYPEALTLLDVGIAPLADTAFTRAKSALKPLEYAALGVAFVASDSPEYRKFHHLGAGSVARTPAEWRSALVRLLGDEVLRLEQVEKNLLVAEEWTYERKSYLWADAWSNAMVNRKAA